MVMPCPCCCLDTGLWVQERNLQDKPVIQDHEWFHNALTKSNPLVQAKRFNKMVLAVTNRCVPDLALDQDEDMHNYLSLSRATSCDSSPSASLTRADFVTT